MPDLFESIVGGITIKPDEQMPYCHFVLLIERFRALVTVKSDHEIATRNGKNFLVWKIGWEDSTSRSPAVYIDQQGVLFTSGFMRKTIDKYPVEAVKQFNEHIEILLSESW